MMLWIMAYCKIKRIQYVERVALKGTVHGDHLVQNAAEHPHVGLVVVLFIAADLGGEVVGRA